MKHRKLSLILDKLKTQSWTERWTEWKRGVPTLKGPQDRWQGFWVWSSKTKYWIVAVLLDLTMCQGFRVWSSKTKYWIVAVLLDLTMCQGFRVWSSKTKYWIVAVLLDRTMCQGFRVWSSETKYWIVVVLLNSMMCRVLGFEDLWQSIQKCCSFPEPDV
jgi:hypothetical protein